MTFGHVVRLQKSEKVSGETCVLASAANRLGKAARCEQPGFVTGDFLGDLYLNGLSAWKMVPAGGQEGATARELWGLCWLVLILRSLSSCAPIGACRRVTERGCHRQHRGDTYRDPAKKSEAVPLEFWQKLFEGENDLYLESMELDSAARGEGLVCGLWATSC